MADPHLCRATPPRPSRTSSTAPTWRKGQTGLSVAFDLPTQTGYDTDHPLARGEVGKVGVPIAPSRRHGDPVRRHPARPHEHLDDDQRHRRPGCSLSTSALAEEQGVDREKLQGTTQNDIIKEYLSRGTYIFPPEPSLRLIADMIAFTYARCRSGTR